MDVIEQPDIANIRRMEFDEKYTADERDTLKGLSAKEREKYDRLAIFHVEGPVPFPVFLDYAKFMAKHGSANGNFNVGLAYLHGVRATASGAGDVEQDLVKALPYLKQAAAKNHAKATFCLFRYYEKGVPGVAPQDADKAFKLLLKSGNLGYVWAQHDLAQMYLMGLEPVEKDADKAFRWMEKAAFKGLALAQFNTGMFYRGGEGVEQDDDLAIHWWTKAAEAGFVPAMEALWNHFGIDFNERLNPHRLN